MSMPPFIPPVRTVKGRVLAATLVGQSIGRRILCVVDALLTATLFTASAPRAEGLREACKRSFSRASPV